MERIKRREGREGKGKQGGERKGWRKEMKEKRKDKEEEIGLKMSY